MKNIVIYTKNHRLKVREILNSPPAPAEKKKYLSSMGIYEERNTNTYMTRVRNPAGVVTLQELKIIAKLADLYSGGEIHFTTRQDIQFHKVKLEHTPDLAEKLMEANLYTRGSGGNGIRNIACSPLSGFDRDEVFDVTPLALQAMDYLLNDIDSFELPRKFKIAFSNSPKDTAYATISDLGFIAKIKDNQKGFEVYAAGGLGKNPATAIKLADFIPAADSLYYIFAMKDFFYREGDRENRNKARIRYILFRLGREEFKNRFGRYLEKARNKYNFSHPETDSAPHEDRDDLTHIYIHPENGFLNTKRLNEIINFIENLDYKTTIRLANTQGFYIRGLKPEDAQKLAQITSCYTSPYDIDNPVTCVGASICKIGLCRSKELAFEIKERFRNTGPAIKSKLPKVFISGCHNSCGQHQIGQIGFCGKLAKTPDGIIESYDVFFNGKTRAGKTKLGENTGELPAGKIPDFLLELANLKHQSAPAGFEEFLEKEKTKIEALKNEL